MSQNSELKTFIGRVPKSAFGMFGVAAFAIVLGLANPQLTTVFGVGVLGIVLGIRELQKTRVELAGFKVSITGRTSFGAFGKPAVVLHKTDITRVEKNGDDLRVYYQRAGKEKKIDYLSQGSAQQNEIYSLLMGR